MNYEVLVSKFEYWPSFHDAEIIWFKGDRNIEGKGENYGAIFECVIHVFEMTNQVDAGGYYILKNHYLVHFKFKIIYDWEFDGFNLQNAILGLTIYPVNNEHLQCECLKIEFDPANGLGGEFKCVSGEVVSVVPCNSDGIKI
ncbi:hypothetical protein KAR48_12635 [bacterium]|nr:hypothetical protein [bacterium]